MVPIGVMALSGLNFPPTAKVSVHTLSCPDMGQEGRREVWVLNTVRSQISKMESESLLQILSLFCHHGDCPSNKQSLW